MFSSTGSFTYNWARNVSLISEVSIEGIDEVDDTGVPTNITPTLTYFQSALFATVLEDTIASLHVLAECNNSLRVLKAMGDMTVLLARKFDVPERTIGDDLDFIDVKQLNCTEYKLQKLEDDRKYLEDVLTGTYVNLSRSKRYQYLRNSLDKAVDHMHHRENIIIEEGNNRTLRRDLNRQLRHLRNHIKSVYYDSNALIESLRTDVEDADLNANIRKRYVENWQVARTEQHEQAISDKEAKPLESIMYYKLRADQEQRVHAEVDLLINISINETLEKVEKMMNKFDTDMEAIDLKIQKKKNQYDNLVIKTDSLEKTIEEHALLLKNWITFKEERVKDRLHREKINNAALTIQAWWRGLLVRNELGPYKVVMKIVRGAKDKKKK